MPNQENSEKAEGAYGKHGPVQNVQFTTKIEPPDAYVYSNVAGMTISPWDIRIHFADVVPTAGGGEAKAKTVVGVLMPPEHAAALTLLLMTQLANFERQFGPIRHPRWAGLRASAQQELDAEIGAELAEESSGQEPQP